MHNSTSSLQSHGYYQAVSPSGAAMQPAMYHSAGQPILVPAGSQMPQMPFGYPVAYVPAYGQQPQMSGQHPMQHMQFMPGPSQPMYFVQANGQLMQSGGQMMQSNGQLMQSNGQFVSWQPTPQYAPMQQANVFGAQQFAQPTSSSPNA